MKWEAENWGGGRFPVSEKISVTGEKQFPNGKRKTERALLSNWTFGANLSPIYF